MRICFDLDGTICETRSPEQKYSEVSPLPGAVQVMKKLKEDGHYLIIATARSQKTYNHNLGKILANSGKMLFEWLDKHDIPYDEIWFGKPLADLYVDDKGHRFMNWKELEKMFKNDR